MNNRKECKWSAIGQGAWLCVRVVVFGKLLIAAVAITFIQPRKIGKGVFFLCSARWPDDKNHVQDIAEDSQNDGDFCYHFPDNFLKYVYLRIFDLKIRWFRIKCFPSVLALVGKKEKLPLVQVEDVFR